MNTNTTIEWTEATWNPTRGCSKVSPGCKNCYAIRQAVRQSGKGKAYEGLVSKEPLNWSGKIGLVRDNLDAPLHWPTQYAIFVNSMSDLYHERVPDWYIEQVVKVMQLANWHTFQILTKRDER